MNKIHTLAQAESTGRAKSKFADRKSTFSVINQNSISDITNEEQGYIRNTSKILNVLRSRFRAKFEPSLKSAFRRRKLVSPLSTKDLERNVKSQDSKRYNSGNRFRVILNFCEILIYFQKYSL